MARFSPRPPRPAPGLRRDIPATFRSSTTITWCRRARRVVAWCSASRRRSAARAWIRPIRAAVRGHRFDAAPARAPVRAVLPGRLALHRPQPGLRRRQRPRAPPPGRPRCRRVRRPPADRAPPGPRRPPGAPGRRPRAPGGPARAAASTVNAQYQRRPSKRTVAARIRAVPAADLARQRDGRLVGLHPANARQHHMGPVIDADRAGGEPARHPGPAAGLEPGKPDLRAAALPGPRVRPLLQAAGQRVQPGVVGLLGVLRATTAPARPCWRSTSGAAPATSTAPRSAARRAHRRNVRPRAGPGTASRAPGPR